MANIKSIVAAHLSQRQRSINRQAERADLLDQDRLLCNIIRVSGNISVPSRPGFVWCQEYSPSDDTSPFHAFNDKVQAREGLSVWVGPGLGGRREVLDWNNATIVNTADYNAQKYLPAHHTDHEWPDFKPGPDVVNVYPRSLSMLRTYPGEGGALTVSASPLRYIKGNVLVLFPGKNSLDISAAQPASGLSLYVGIYLDPDDNTLKSVNGSTTGDSPAITPDSPAFPESAILSANVRLDGDQTTFSEVDIVDVRQILDSSGAIDGTRISKLVSPDGLTDPVLSADNSGDVTLAGTGTLTIPTDLIHAGDITTKIGFTTGVQTFSVVGVDMLTLTNAAQDLITLGPGSGDVDIDFNGDMFLRGSDGFFGVGVVSPETALDVAGTLQLNSTVDFNNIQLTNQLTDASDKSAGITMKHRTIAEENVGIMLGFINSSNAFVDFGGGQATVNAATQLRMFVAANTTTVVGSLAVQINSTGMGLNGVSSPSTALDIGAGAMEYEEMTAPAAGAANSVRIYAEDNGAGKTRLMAIFNTGAAQQVAIQP